jgi:alkanesulfonate monooxygenase SsuD/methylene tetrahydromethanopterin reductase-like flavin-dependent oxidoreductase (luciferase family)
MQEYDWFNVPVSESHGRYREAMDFMIQAWQSDGPMSFHGQFFNVDNYRYFPAPIQKPFPAVYASGSTTPDSYIWAGSKGLNLGTALFMPDRDAIRRNIGLYRTALAENGYDPASRELCAITQMYCAEDGEEAVRDGAEYALNYYRFFSQLDKQAKDSTVPDFYQNADVSAMTSMNDADLVFFGDPDNLTRRLGAVGEDLGIDLLLMEVAQGRAPVKKVRKALELFGREVMPRLREEEAAKTAHKNMASVS